MNAKIIGEKIKQIMKQKNITTEELAKKLKISTKDLNKKLTGEKEFLANEASEIANVFELTIQEFASIFFNPKVSLESQDKKEVKR